MRAGQKHISLHFLVKRVMNPFPKSFFKAILKLSLHGIRASFIYHQAWVEVSLTSNQLTNIPSLAQRVFDGVTHFKNKVEC